MEFDRDWIVPAIFVGVMLVRALGSRIARGSKESQPKVAKPMKQPPSKGFAHPDVYRPGDQPKPIEPR
jgi:hypothetical protein